MTLTLFLCHADYLISIDPRTKFVGLLVMNGMIEILKTNKLGNDARQP